MLLVNNISDNLDVFEDDKLQIHALVAGYDFDNGSFYAIWSKDLSKGQRYDMGMETIEVLSMIKNKEYKAYGPRKNGKIRQNNMQNQNSKFFRMNSHMGSPGPNKLLFKIDYQLNDEINQLRDFIYPYWFGERYGQE